MFARASQEEDRMVAKRVAQRLGTWSPPPLSEAEREKLVLEREALLREIAKVEARRAAAARELAATAAAAAAASAHPGSSKPPLS
jgi:hypothetical protein